MLSYNSLTNKDLTYERFRTKDYVRIFNLFMQNKPNFQKPKMTINYCTERTYKDFIFSDLPKNKPKQSQNKPNQTQFADYAKQNHWRTKNTPTNAKYIPRELRPKLCFTSEHNSGIIIQPTNNSITNNPIEGDY